MTLKLIGYWRGGDQSTSDLPHPSEWVDWSWDADERAVVGAYLASGTILRAYMGVSSCRICGRANGAVEYTDGTFLWPQGLAHYVDDHGVRLPDELVRHVQQRSDSLEVHPVSDDWWRAQSVHRSDVASSATTTNPDLPKPSDVPDAAEPSISSMPGSEDRFLEHSSVWSQMARLLTADHGPRILSATAMGTVRGSRAELTWTELHEMTADAYRSLVERARAAVHDP